MKVVLLKDIKNLGRLGETKEVSEGYARNYLLPNKLVSLPKSNLSKEITGKILEQKIEHKHELENLTAQAKKIDGKSYEFFAKADQSGKLYGSLSPTIIAEKIGVEPSQIKFHLKQLGVFKEQISFGKNVFAEVEIEIKKQA